MKAYDFKKVLQICLHEWQRVFVTGSGRLTLLTFFGVWVLIFHYPVRTAVELISVSGDAGIIRSMLGDIGFRQLLQWPVAELSVFWFAAMLLLPLTCISLCCDQFASDRQRGTVKFYLLRCRRSEFLIGRFLGYASFFTLLMLSLVIITLVYAWVREPSSLSSGIRQGSDTFIFLTIWMVPFIALANFLNVLLPSGKKVILVTILLYLLLPTLDYLAASKLQINLQTTLALPGLGVFSTMGDTGPSLDQLTRPLLQTVSYLFLSSLIFKLRSLG
ncbi:hypothetical protein [Thalassotalea mangrovi]|uniref:ABC transporter permease n=1 Tax=Thalassotalea mangrovi TaxID=2572245 RepID=A0A4U1B3I2_9GAMM|nr:hypothetical protein [Thalassotalea mangrovi]TKB44398.1 hypothetical protein E8M12_12150 [Thalassotalea mangrovi]